MTTSWTFSLGRCTGLYLGSVKRSGRQVTITGSIVGTSAYDAATKRQQLLGMVDNGDEDAVPLVSGSDDLDGFYRVTGASVEPTGPLRGVGRKFSVDLEQVTGYANPWFEVVVQSLVRTNGFSLTTPNAITAIVFSSHESMVPSALGSLNPSGDYVSDWPSTSSPAVQVLYANANAPVAANAYQFTAPPAAFLWGRCRVEVSPDGGTTWCEMVGRQIPASTLWRISNGIIRLTAANGATPGKIEHWDDTAAAWEGINVKHWYDTTSAHGIGIGFGDQTIKPYVSVLRNSIEQVVVSVNYPGYDHASVTNTYSIQRGAHQVVMRGNVLTGIGPNTPTASTVASSSKGVYSTSADGNGNRLIVGSPGGVGAVADATNGCVVPANAGDAVWLSMDWGAGSGPGPNTLVECERFLGTPLWTQRVVAR